MKNKAIHVDELIYGASKTSASHPLSGLLKPDTPLPADWDYHTLLDERIAEEESETGAAFARAWGLMGVEEGELDLTRRKEPMREVDFGQLDDLAGSWVDDPEMDKVLDEQEKIDEEMWK